MRRVVVTGIGMVTPLGLDAATTWSNLINSKSGVRSMHEVSTAMGLQSSVFANVQDFTPEHYMTRRLSERFDRFIQFAVAATKEAMNDAGYPEISEDLSLRTGTLIGSGVGGFIGIEKNAQELFTKGRKGVSPFFITGSLINLVSGTISSLFKVRGPNFSLVSACATGTHAIGEAARIIMCGDADVMICGGTEASLCPLSIAGFDRIMALSRNPDPNTASRPWDTERDGFVIGEGSGILVIEELEHAKKRGAKIYGEIVGYAATSDASDSPVLPDKNGESSLRGIKIAMTKAGINDISEVDYINAHATSTPQGDAIELEMIERLFDDSGASHKNTVMSSTKSSTGHLLGAAGSVEAIFCLLAMQDGIVPATLNLKNPYKNTKINLVPKSSINKKINISLSNSLGFGGTNAVIIFKKI